MIRRAENSYARSGRVGRLGYVVGVSVVITVISAFACPGFSQDGEAARIEVLKEVLSKYSGFGLVKIAVKSKGHMQKDGKPGDMQLLSDCDIEAYLSAPNSRPMRIDYLLKKRRWFNAAAEFSQEWAIEVIGEDFFAEIKHQEGVPGSMKDKNIVMLHSQDTPHENYNRCEVGDAYWLLNQKIFNEIPIMDFMAENGSDSALLKIVEEGILNENQVIKIVFERNHHGHDERDTLYLSLELGFALVKRRFTSETDEKTAKALIKMGVSSPINVREFVLEMSKFHKVDKGFLPMSCRYSLVLNGNLHEEIRTDVSSVRKTSVEEIRKVFSTVPEGHRVIDGRGGGSYLVGKEGMKWPGKVETKE